MTAMCDTLALMFGGQGDGLELCRDGCWLYTADKRAWTNLSSSAPASRMGHAACYDPVRHTTVCRNRDVVGAPFQEFCLCTSKSASSTAAVGEEGGLRDRRSKVHAVFQGLADF
jgi:hypothetical protein